MANGIGNNFSPIHRHEFPLPFFFLSQLLFLIVVILFKDMLDFPSCAFLGVCSHPVLCLRLILRIGFEDLNKFSQQLASPYRRHGGHVVSHSDNNATRESRVVKGQHCGTRKP